MYGRILIPDAVLDESTVAGAGRTGASEIAAAAWLDRIHADVLPEPLLAKELGRGEAEVISAAYLLKAQLVLIDERRARRIAEQAYGLRVKGSAGILVSAKRKGLIPAVGPLLESLNARGYYLSRRLIDRAVEEAGESRTN
jgi:predicted nucleic acid-binding protein